MFDWDGVGDVDEERPVFEQGNDEEVVVVWVEFGGVDWGGEFDKSDSFLCLEVPEDGAPVLRGCEEVAAAARPAGGVRLE